VNIVIDKVPTIMIDGFCDIAFRND